MPRPTHPYLATAEGWLYLAVIIDLVSRRVVGCVFRRCRTPVPAEAEHSIRAMPNTRADLTTLVFGGYFVGFFPLVKPWVLRMDSPTSLTRWALCTSRSQIESATVASPMTACH